MDMPEGGLVAQATHTLGTEVLAAGELRQGRAPTGPTPSLGALLKILWQRHSKTLPRRFTLAVTADRVAAIKSNSVGTARAGDYRVILHGGERASWPRGEVWLEAPEGAAAKGGILNIPGEQIPVFRPLLSGDEETDALFALLAS